MNTVKYCSVTRIVQSCSTDSAAYPVFWSTHPVCRLLAQARTLVLQSDLSGPGKAVSWHLKYTCTPGKFEDILKENK